MFIFYDSFTCILFSCFTSVVVLFGSGIYLAKRKLRISPMSSIFMFWIFVLSFVIAGVLFFSVGLRLQIAVVEPYIQQSLDRQCGQGVYQATEGKFSNGSGASWQSNRDSASCYFNDKDGWNCSCK